MTSQSGDLSIIRTERRRRDDCFGKREQQVHRPQGEGNPQQGWDGQSGGAAVGEGPQTGKASTCGIQDKPRNRESKGKPLKGLVSWNDPI